MAQEFHSYGKNLYQGERKDVVNNNAGVRVASAAAYDGGSQVQEKESSGFGPNENANTTQSHTISDSIIQALSVSNLYGKIQHLPPLNLKLENWESLADSLEALLIEKSGNQCSTQMIQNSGYRQETPKPRIPYFPPPPVPEKMKATKFPVLVLKIGSWERVSVHAGDLVGKCYYKKKKLVWEILEMSLTRKFEINWADIVGISATAEENKPGILELELRQPPTFHQEVNFQPRNPTNWKVSEDFTGGQAMMWRRHYLKISPGVLDSHFVKLLQCDSRLFELSQRPFPTLDTAQFQPTNPPGISEFSLSFGGQRPQIYPGLHFSDSHMNPSLSSAQQDPSQQPRMQMQMPQQPRMQMQMPQQARMQLQMPQQARMQLQMPQQARMQMQMAQQPRMQMQMAQQPRMQMQQQPRMQMQMQQPSFSLNDLSSPDSADQVGGSHYVDNPGMRFSGQATNNFPTHQVSGYFPIASTTPTVPTSYDDNDYGDPRSRCEEDFIDQILMDEDFIDQILMDSVKNTLMTDSDLESFDEESAIPKIDPYEALINQANNGQDISAGGDMGFSANAHTNDTAGHVYQQPVSRMQRQGSENPWFPAQATQEMPISQHRNSLEYQMGNDLDSFNQNGDNKYT